MPQDTGEEDTEVGQCAKGRLSGCHVTARSLCQVRESLDNKRKLQDQCVGVLGGLSAVGLGTHREKGRGSRGRAPSGVQLGGREKGGSREKGGG